MGNEETAIKVIVAENGPKVTKKSLLLQKRTVRVERGLDLTDQAVLDKLSVAKKKLISVTFDVTRQLGFLARKHGFVAIKSYSSKGDGINLIRPKGFP